MYTQLKFRIKHQTAVYVSYFNSIVRVKSL